MFSQLLFLLLHLTPSVHKSGRDRAGGITGQGASQVPVLERQKAVLWCPPGGPEVGWSWGAAFLSFHTLFSPSSFLLSEIAPLLTGTHILPFSPMHCLEMQAWGPGHSKKEPTVHAQKVTETWEVPPGKCADWLPWGYRDPSECPLELPFKSRCPSGNPCGVSVALVQDTGVKESVRVGVKSRDPCSSF